MIAPASRFRGGRDLMIDPALGNHGPEAKAVACPGADGGGTGLASTEQARDGHGAGERSVILKTAEETGGAMVPV
jgi:hypothetical protein